MGCTMLALVKVAAGRGHIELRDVPEPQIHPDQVKIAVRAAACVTCHAEFYSSIITDFGHGSPNFFGTPESGNKVGPFNGHIYGDFMAGSDRTGWLTAKFHKNIIVPENAAIEFSLKRAADGIISDQALYTEAFKAASLSGYLRALENQKEIVLNDLSFTLKPGKILGLLGRTGSGKTTLTSLLSKHYGWEAHFEDNDDNPYLNDFYDDMQRWSFNLQIYFLNTRFNQILEFRKSGKTIIQDRTIYEDAYIFAPNLHSMGLMSTTQMPTQATTTLVTLLTTGMTPEQ